MLAKGSRIVIQSFKDEFAFDGLGERHYWISYEQWDRAQAIAKKYVKAVHNDPKWRPQDDVLGKALARRMASVHGELK